MKFLRFALTTIITTIGLLSSTTNLLFASNSPFQTQSVVSTSNPSATLAAMFKTALEVTKNGDIQAGILKARDAKLLAQQSGQFQAMVVVEYMNTMASMLQATQTEKKAGVLAEVMATIEQLKGLPDFGGKGNPQVGYYFLVATGAIADRIFDSDQQAFVKLQKHRGLMARNLVLNSAYPADGKAFLAAPLVDLAIGLALEKDIEGAKQAITEACELGFCEFHKLLESPAWAIAKKEHDLESHLAQLHGQYLEKLKIWSAQELENFDNFRFPFQVDSVRGGTLSSEDYDGKVLVVDLWATWCQPCREALPHFNNLNRDYRRFGVRVVGISMDSPETPDRSIEAVRDYLSDNDIKIPCGVGSAELKSQLPADLKLPTTLFIDRNGTVRYMASGYQNYEKIAAITETLVVEKQPVTTNTRTAVSSN